MRAIAPAFVLLFLSLPAAAQDVDFGDDASIFANDGQCDDGRFTGPGMTATALLDSDIGHDASDCRQAWEAGQLQLAITAPPVTPPADNGFSPAGTGKTDKVRGGDTAGPVVPELVIIDGILFGDDSGEYTGDGECDDRRFFGPGMADSINWASTGRDATDCSQAYLDGQVRLWNADASMAATSCQAIDFGDDSGEYPKDGECDDYRFEGRGVGMRLSRDTIGQDASDCRQLCIYGTLSLREY